MKKILSIILVILLLLSGLFFLTGCEDKDKAKTVEISYEYSERVTLKTLVSAIKTSDGQDVAEYNFINEKPEKALTSGTFYLVTDKAIFTFYTRGLVYNTSEKYIEKYGNQEATFTGYLEYINDPENNVLINNKEQIKIGSRDVLKIDYKEGIDSGELCGYNYLFSIDDLMPGYVFEMVVSPKEGKDGNISEVMNDKKVIDIINSITLEVTPSKYKFNT